MEVDLWLIIVCFHRPGEIPKKRNSYISGELITG